MRYNVSNKLEENGPVEVGRNEFGRICLQLAPDNRMKMKQKKDNRKKSLCRKEKEESCRGIDV